MRRLSLLILALAAAVPAHAGPSVEQLVERAFRSPRSTAHTGTVSVTIAREPESTASVRISCDGRGRELREHLDGPARGLTVLTDGRKTWQRARDARLWTALQTPPADRSSWDRMRRNYRFRKQGEEGIAGRKAVVVAVTPTHAGNPRQTLWLDAATALVLRTDGYSYAGDLAMTTRYTSFTPGAPPASTFEAPESDEVAPAVGAEWWKECSSEAELRRQAGKATPLPTRLPPGYTLVAYYLRGCRQGGTLPVVRYEDGLNALTLFVTPGPGGGRGMGRGRGWGWGWGRGRGQGRGTCILSQVAGQQVARITHDGYTYVLVGDHQPDSLEATLNSIE